MEFLERYWLSIAVSLGCGLLIGIERERRKGRGASRRPAGVRTFAIASLAGALTQALGQPMLVAAGALLVLLLAAISHWKSLPGDPGITTEIALFITFVLGVTSIDAPMLAGAVAAIVTMLLAARSRLHHFSTRLLTEAEARDGLVLAGAALVVLPLMPERPLDWLAGVQPRTIWRLVVMLLAVQAAGHVAVRVLGPRAGLPLSGLLSGFASSTATFAAMGARAREHPAQAGACASGAMFSNVATFAQLALVSATLCPALLSRWWAALAAGAVVAIAAAWLTLPRAAAALGRDAVAGPGAGSAEQRVFDPGKSMLFAMVLGGVTALATWTGEHVGAGAALVGASLAGFVDVHASLASISLLVNAGHAEVGAAGLPLLMGLAANTASKLVAAGFAGGPHFAWRVFPGLLSMLVVAGLMVLLA